MISRCSNVYRTSLSNFKSRGIIKNEFFIIIDIHGSRYVLRFLNFEFLLNILKLPYKFSNVEISTF